MYDRDLVSTIFVQMSDSCGKILKRFKRIKSHSDFLKDDKGLEKLDSISMQLIAIGESIKNINKITNKTLLKKYLQIEKQTYGITNLRDVRHLGGARQSQSDAFGKKPVEDSTR